MGGKVAINEDVEQSFLFFVSLFPHRNSAWAFFLVSLLITYAAAVKYHNLPFSDIS